MHSYKERLAHSTIVVFTIGQSDMSGRQSYGGLIDWILTSEEILPITHLEPTPRQRRLHPASQERHISSCRSQYTEFGTHHPTYRDSLARRDRRLIKRNSSQSNGLLSTTLLRGEIQVV